MPLGASLGASERVEADALRHFDLPRRGQKVSPLCPESGVTPLTERPRHGADTPPSVVYLSEATHRRSENAACFSYSHTVRNFIGTGETNINSQIVGVNLRFSPEPEPTVALLCGLALLSVLGARRRQGSARSRQGRSSR